MNDPTTSPNSKPLTDEPESLSDHIKKLRNRLAEAQEKNDLLGRENKELRKRNEEIIKGLETKIDKAVEKKKSQSDPFFGDWDEEEEKGSEE